MPPCPLPGSSDHVHLVLQGECIEPVAAVWSQNDSIDLKGLHSQYGGISDLCMQSTTVIVKSFENLPAVYNFCDTMFISHVLFALDFVTETKLELLKLPYLCIFILADAWGSLKESP